MKSRAFVFGDGINTDMIINRKYYRGDKPISETAKHVFEPVRPDFTNNLEDGDIVIAGKHFGSGSSRPAHRFLKEAGVAAVVAESFSRIYYRNSISEGMPAIICPGVTDQVEEGDEIEIDLDRCVIINHTQELEISFESYPELFEEFRESGGLFEYYKQSPNSL